MLLWKVLNSGFNDTRQRNIELFPCTEMIPKTPSTYSVVLKLAKYIPDINLMLTFHVETVVLKSGLRSKSVEKH